MVEIEQSAQTLPPLNVGGQAHRRWRSLQELVVESLVVSLAMVVFDVLAHEETHVRCFRHQLLLPRPYLVLTKPLRLDIQCQRAASVKIGWKYLDD